MSDKIKELVKQELNKKAWTFAEIANVSSTIDNISEAIYDDIPTKDKLNMVWNVDVFAEELTPFGQIYSNVIQKTLKEKVAEIVKNELQEAKVSFKEDNKNEVSKGSLGGKPSKTRASNEKRTDDEQE
tara:strand:- start:3641 stop:4024 length:384 start_codon:yes stop_codon:yes gene_type:complete